MFANPVLQETYDNGWAISVLNGQGTYSGPGTFEVAVINPDGIIDYEYTGGSDVGAYYTQEQVDNLCVLVKEIGMNDGKT